MSEQRAVVLGVDSFDTPVGALTWAVRDAGARRLPLRLVCAYDLVVPDGTAWNYIDRPRVDRTYSRMAAQRAVDEIARRAAELDPAIELLTEVVEDGAVPALLNESIRAQSVVLGTRHISAAGAVLLGSVSAAVAAARRLPVHRRPGC